MEGMECVDCGACEECDNKEIPMDGLFRGLADRLGPQVSKAITDAGVEYRTGAVRSADAESVRYDLISPVGLAAVARACAEGAEKYSDYNWERGMPASDLLNHALQHIYKFLSGDRSEDHLGHAGWNVLGAIHSLEVWPELNKGRFRQNGCRHPDAE